MRRVLLLSMIIAGHAAGAGLNTAKLADAIYEAEGGPAAAAPYGILAVHVRNAVEARQVCIRTIEHARRDYSALRTPHAAFIDFLADRYCPPSVDLQGNRNWKRNVKHLMK